MVETYMIFPVFNFPFLRNPGEKGIEKRLSYCLLNEEGEIESPRVIEPNIDFYRF